MLPYTSIFNKQFIASTREWADAMLTCNLKLADKIKQAMREDYGMCERDLTEAIIDALAE